MFLIPWSLRPEWIAMPKPPINKELLDILACPICKSGVRLRKGKLVCIRCGREYPLVDGIPIMLPEEARLKN
ncbi:MAG: Trm112 family protein [Candidatus Hadarchaeum sp.]|uniref:Trm112 family protein n=1 Tax=Candidatus Hadarchaeum sp. TaxID=2883567 RepID=UPI003D112F8F